MISCGGLRPELVFEDVPAPRTLAPYASAMAATVLVDDEEIASGRLVLLYDPAGQTGWAGSLRVIAYIHADLDPDIAEDPLIGQVGWTWLTEALGQRTARLRRAKRHGDHGRHRGFRGQGIRARGHRVRAAGVLVAGWLFPG